MTDQRIDLTLLGGFLGSGKTTWLRHQLHRGQMDDALVIVNEAADLPVDGAVLARSSRVAVLAGGCACCERRAALVALLRDICDARVDRKRRGSRVDRIVLETSGVADPAAIAEALRTDPVLVHHLRLRETVVTVDAVNGLAQLRSEPTSRRQIETADRLVVTKIDAAETGPLRRLLAVLAALNPGAPVSGAVLGSAAALPEPDDSAPELPPIQADATGAIVALRLNLGSRPDWSAFSVWLSALLHARGEDVMRVKGVIRTPAGRLLLQSVRKVVNSPEVLPDCAAAAAAGDNSLAIIGRGLELEALSRSLRSFSPEPP